MVDLCASLVACLRLFYTSPSPYGTAFTDFEGVNHESIDVQLTFLSM